VQNGGSLRRVRVRVLLEAARDAVDPELQSIARANYALALFETGQDAAAILEARRLVRRCVGDADRRG
jgi:hypothetical protein